MADWLISIVPPLLLALGGAFAIEWLASVRQEGIGAVSWRVSDVAIRLGAYLLLTVFWFQFSWRPWLASASCVATLAVMCVIDRMKRRVIGEPLVFSDFALLRQVPRHPELYYTRSLSDPRMAGPLLAALAIVVFWFVVEPTLLPASDGAAVAAVVLLPLALTGLALAFRSAPGRHLLRSRFPQPDLPADIARYGLVAVTLAYLLRRDAEKSEPRPSPPPVPAVRAAGSGDVLVVVQLESFLDPVRLGGPPLPVMERIRNGAALYGRLTVPAHGAYTMRTEHALLTGIEGARLGFGAFDPYLATGGHDPESLARRARAAGYEPVFVHPFHPDFFERAQVMRAFGFERLVMEEGFSGAPRVGPYIADLAVAERILTEVQDRKGPIFVFCVTMENHGPWKPGRLPGIDDPLNQYLHHIANTGRAVEALIEGLSGSAAGRKILCVYGDHAPSLPSCPPGTQPQTDYALFRFGADTPRETGAFAQRRQDLDAAELGRLLQDAVLGENEPQVDSDFAVPRS